MNTKRMCGTAFFGILIIAGAYCAFPPLATAFIGVIAAATFFMAGFDRTGEEEDRYEKDSVFKYWP